VVSILEIYQENSLPEVTRLLSQIIKLLKKLSNDSSFSTFLRQFGIPESLSKIRILRRHQPLLYDTVQSLLAVFNKS